MKCEDMPEYLMSYATKITETVRGSAQIHLRKNSFQCWVTEKDLCPLNGQSASKSLPTKPSLFHLLQPVYNSTFTEQQQQIFHTALETHLGEFQHTASVYHMLLSAQDLQHAFVPSGSYFSIWGKKKKSQRAFFSAHSTEIPPVWRNHKLRQPTALN